MKSINAKFRARNVLVDKVLTGDGAPTAFFRYIFIVLALISTPIMTARAQDTSILSDSQFEIYGFAQVDYIQNFKRANPNWDDTLRPSRIPTQDGIYGSDGQASLSVKQSRLGFKSESQIEEHVLKTKFEFDFFGVGTDEGQTTVRLRHAFGEWGMILAGQAESLFMDVDIFPNTIDYWGPAGMVFLRNPQIRLTPYRSDSDTFAVAIERPSNDIDAERVREFDPALGDAIQNDEKVPDVTAHFRHEGAWGHLQLAGIVRSIGFETKGTPANEPKDRHFGWGTNLTSVIKASESDSLKFGAVIGEGIASYMNDGGNDLAPARVNGSAGTEPLPLFGVSAYLDHVWTKTLSSSVGASRTQVDNTDLQTSDAFHRGDYASVNLLYAPSSRIMFGGEVLYGSREDNDGARGEDFRTQISVRYSFSSGNIVIGSQKS